MLISILQDHSQWSPTISWFTVMQCSISSARSSSCGITTFPVQLMCLPGSLHFKLSLFAYSITHSQSLFHVLGTEACAS